MLERSALLSHLAATDLQQRGIDDRERQVVVRVATVRGHLALDVAGEGQAHALHRDPLRPDVTMVDRDMYAEGRDHLIAGLRHGVHEIDPALDEFLDGQRRRGAFGDEGEGSVDRALDRIADGIELFVVLVAHGDGECEAVALLHVGLGEDEVAEALSAADGVVVLVVMVGIGSDFDLLPAAGRAGDEEIDLVAAVQTRVVRRDAAPGVVEKKQAWNHRFPPNS